MMQKKKVEKKNRVQKQFRNILFAGTFVAVMAATSFGWSGAAAMHHVQAEEQAETYAVSDSTLPETNIAVNITTYGVKVTWNQVSSADGYRVSRKEKGDSEWTRIKTIKSNNKTSYTDKKAESGKKYVYKVEAYATDADGQRIYGKASKCKTFLYLKAPTVTLKAQESGVKVAWSKSAGTKKYVIYRKENYRFSKWKKIASVSGSKKSYLDACAEGGVAYLYKVKAITGNTVSTSKKATVTQVEDYELVSSIFEDEVSSIIQKGDYYFKRVETSKYSYAYYVSKNMYYGYKQIASEGTSVLTNGKIAYYIKGSYLYKYNLATQRSKKLKKIPMINAEEAYLDVSDAYGDFVVICRGAYGWAQDTAVYNLKTKKTKIVKNNMLGIKGRGKYFVAADNIASSMDYMGMSLWKYTSTGVKKIKTLAKYGAMEGLNTVYIADRYIYYASFKNAWGDSMTIYRCNIDGSGTKKLVTKGSSSKSGNYTFYYVTKLTDEYVIFQKIQDSGSKTYKYTFRTKTTTVVSADYY